jgi:DNA-binding response OmpR family regulator
MRRRILIVEPDGNVRDAIGATLKKLGCAVRFTDTALRAFEIASRERPDLVLLSADVPDNADLSVCTRFKEHAELRKIPLIVLTGLADPAIIEAHRRLPSCADDYVRKPIATYALIRRMEMLVPLGGRRAAPPSRPAMAAVNTSKPPPPQSVPARPRNDDRVRIDEAGAVQALGTTAAERLRSQHGDFRLLPSPPELVVLHRADGAHRKRKCRISGEVFAPGALCDVVSLIAQARWSGELALLDAHQSRSIFFEPGYVVSAQSTVPRERLDEVLYSYGALTREQIKVASQHAEREGIRFGEAAVALGHLGQDVLFQLMGKQTEEIFFGALLEESGSFYFFDHYDEVKLSHRQRQAIMPLMTDAVRRMDETKFFSEKIPSDQHIAERVEDRPGSVPIDAELTNLFAAIDGTRSVADISRVMGKGVFEVMKGLFVLVQTGHVTMRRPAQIYEAIDVYNRAITLILRELDAMDEGDDVRTELATFASEGLYASLLRGAGPADDGTFDAQQITRNAVRLSPPGEALPLIADLLYEYASYAMFLARPRLQRAEEQEKSTEPTTEPTPKRRLSGKIESVLARLASSRTPTGKRNG